MQQMPLSLAHLDLVNDLLYGDLLVSLTPTNRLHSDSALLPGAWLRRLLFGGNLFNRRYTALALQDGTLKSKPSGTVSKLPQNQSFYVY